MGEMKPTPGPWYVSEKAPQHRNLSVRYKTGDRDYPMVAIAVVNGRYGDKHPFGTSLDNARLIVEAGTVFHNTGLSPVQLVEQRDELLAALRKMVAVHEYPADNLLQPSKEQLWISMANAALSMARAALAKCEGVGK